jgi:uncharacterized delta-60 repeat protein
MNLSPTIKHAFETSDFVRLAWAVITFGAVCTWHSYARPLPPTVLDNSFKPDLAGWDIGSIRTVLQPDNKLIVASSSNGIPVIARLNEDGSRDTTFQPPPLAVPMVPAPNLYTWLDALILQDDGKILLAVSYNVSPAASTNQLLRLNPDGSLDSTFAARLPDGENPYRVQPLSDGRIFVASSLGGEGDGALGGELLSNSAQLLTSSGMMSPLLISRPHFANQGQNQPLLASVALAPDGTLLVAGQFVTPGTNLVRVNADGTLDKSFQPQLPAGLEQVSAVALQSDGEILAALVFGPAKGSSLTQPDLSETDLIRLLPDGQTDASFVPAHEVARFSTIDSIRVLPNDQILIASGQFRTLRLKRDGSLDLDFNAIVGLLDADLFGPAVLDDSDRLVALIRMPPTVWNLWPIQLARFFTHGFSKPGVEFAQARYLADETDPTALISLRRTGSVAAPLSVQALTSDGTAKAGTNYVSRSGPVDFAAGQATNSFEVPLLHRFGVEGNQTVMLTLRDPGPGAVLSGPDKALLVIADNERPTLLDPTFHAEFGSSFTSKDGSFTPWVQSVLPLANGKIVVAGGLSSSPAGVLRVARLNRDGTSDFEFVSPRTPENDQVWALASQSDGKLLVGGSFTQMNGLSRTGLVRLNRDGSLDMAFNPLFAPQGVVVNSVAVQPDGELLVSGLFGSVNGSDHNSIVRLNPDGTVDPSFQGQVQSADKQLPYAVDGLLLQPDGRILIRMGGNGFSVDGQASWSPARLNTDGSIDPSFIPATGFGDPILLQSNSRILTYSPYTHSDVRRFNADGSVDPSFQLQIDPGRSIWGVLPTTEGGLLVGEWDVDGTALLCRLTNTGLIERTYPLNNAVIPYSPLVLVNAGDALFLGGSFSQFNGVPCPGIVRLLPLGNTMQGLQFSSSTTEVGEDAASATLLVVRTGNGGTGLTAGYATEGDPAYAGTTGTICFAPFETMKELTFPILHDPTVNSNRQFSVRLTNPGPGVLLGAGPAASIITIHDVERPGGVDFTFTPSIRSANYPLNRVEHLALQPDGKVLASGGFVSSDGDTLTTLERLNPDGSLDQEFEVVVQPDTGWGVSSTVSFIIPRSNGKLVVGGRFTRVSGEARNGLARLEPDGSLDESFDPDELVSGPVGAVAVQDDERILVAGAPSPNGAPPQPILARLNPDGESDPSFTPPSELEQVTALVLQPDGKVLAAASMAGDYELVRLDKSGIFDSTFRAVRILNNLTSDALVVQRDGKIVTRDCTGKPIRLSADGSIDSTFAASPNATAAGPIAVQSDGRILLNLNGANVGRLNQDGSLDPSFDSGKDTSGPANSLLVQSDGSVLVAGTFSTFDGVPRSGLVRLHGDPELRLTSLAQHPDGGVNFTWLSLPGRSYVVEGSSDLRTWSQVQSNIATSYELNFRQSSPAGEHRFYRVKEPYP